MKQGKIGSLILPFGETDGFKQDASDEFLVAKQ